MCNFSITLLAEGEKSYAAEKLKLENFLSAFSRDFLNERKFSGTNQPWEQQTDRAKDEGKAANAITIMTIYPAPGAAPL